MPPGPKPLLLMPSLGCSPWPQRARTKRPSGAARPSPSKTRRCRAQIGFCIMMILWKPRARAPERERGHHAPQRRQALARRWRRWWCGHGIRAVRKVH